MQAMTVFCYNNEFRAVNCRGYCWVALFCYACTRYPIAIVLVRHTISLFFFVIEAILLHKQDNGLILGVFSLVWRMFMFRCVCSCAIFLMAAIYCTMSLRLFISCECDLLIFKSSHKILTSYDIFDKLNFDYAYYERLIDFKTIFKEYFGYCTIHFQVWQMFVALSLRLLQNFPIQSRWHLFY